MTLRGCAAFVLGFSALHLCRGPVTGRTPDAGASDMLDWHPHVHAIATKGGWGAGGSFVPIPFVSTVAAERLFRHKVIAMLRDEGLLTGERIALLMSWRHAHLQHHGIVTRSFEALCGLVIWAWHQDLGLVAELSWSAHLPDGGR